MFAGSSVVYNPYTIRRIGYKTVTDYLIPMRIFLDDRLPLAANRHLKILNYSAFCCKKFKQRLLHEKNLDQMPNQSIRSVCRGV